MKYLFIVVCCFLFITCNRERKQDPIQSTRIVPTSILFTALDSSFTINLSSVFQQLKYAGRDTIQTISGKALEDSYVLDNDSLSMIISIGKFDSKSISKRPDAKVFESAINNFLHVLDAKKTKTMRCAKIIDSVNITGERTLFTLKVKDSSFFGVSEMYRRDNTLHHLCIISSKKEDFTQSNDIALAFNSFMPR